MGLTLCLARELLYQPYYANWHLVLKREEIFSWLHGAGSNSNHAEEIIVIDVSAWAAGLAPE